MQKHFLYIFYRNLRTFCSHRDKLVKEDESPALSLLWMFIFYMLKWHTDNKADFRLLLSSAASYRMETIQALWTFTIKLQSVWSAAELEEQSTLMRRTVWATAWASVGVELAPCQRAPHAKNTNDVTAQSAASLLHVSVCADLYCVSASHYDVWNV